MGRMKDTLINLMNEYPEMYQDAPDWNEQVQNENHYWKLRADEHARQTAEYNDLINSTHIEPDIPSGWRLSPSEPLDGNKKD